MNTTVSENVEPAGTRELHFSIEGAFVARAARERLFEFDDLVGAMELIMHATVTDQLSEAERAAQALAILDGRKTIAGVYPGPTYGVYDVPEDERDPRRTLAAYFQRLHERLSTADERARELQNKLTACASVLTDERMAACDREYRLTYDPHGTIFDEYRPEDESTSALVDNLLFQRHRGPEHPYGWLFPDGTFYPVEWGEHQGWAYKWLMNHDPEFRHKERYGDRTPIHLAGDYLNERHRAVLLHNPSMGVADVTNPSGRPLTRAQREFLFNYYANMDLDERASAFYADD